MNNPQTQVQAFNKNYPIGQLVEWNGQLFNTATEAVVIEPQKVPAVGLQNYFQYVPLDCLHPVLTIEGMVKK